MSFTRFRVNPYSIVAWISRNSCWKQARNLKFKWMQRYSNTQPHSWWTNTQPFRKTWVGQSRQCLSRVVSVCTMHLTVCSYHVTYVFQSTTRTWLDKNIQSNAPYRKVLTMQLNHLTSLAKWWSVCLRIKWL